MKKDIVVEKVTLHGEIFEYGYVVYQHRFSIRRSLNDYEEIALNKVLRMGLQLVYKTMACDKLVYELQILHRDASGKVQCLKLDLHDWTISIKHVGDMQINI